MLGTAPILPNHRVQATPDYALLFIVSQVSGASEAGTLSRATIPLNAKS